MICKFLPKWRRKAMEHEESDCVLACFFNCRWALKTETSMWLVLAIFPLSFVHHNPALIEGIHYLTPQVFAPELIVETINITILP